MKIILRLMIVSALFFVFSNEPPRKQAEAEVPAVTSTPVQNAVVTTSETQTAAPKPTPAITGDIPNEVFCGSPKQRNTKRPNKANVSIGKEMAASYGWTGNQWKALLELWSCESQWNHLSINPRSGAGGIPQSWPATKMATFGADYATNPRTQIAWGLAYINRTYKTPQAALEFHYRNNWY